MRWLAAAMHRVASPRFCAHQDANRKRGKEDHQEVWFTTALDGGGDTASEEQERGDDQGPAEQTVEEPARRQRQEEPVADQRDFQGYLRGGRRTWILRPHDAGKQQRGSTHGDDCEAPEDEGEADRESQRAEQEVRPARSRRGCETPTPSTCRFHSARRLLPRRSPSTARRLRINRRTRAHPRHPSHFGSFGGVNVTLPDSASRNATN